MRNSLLFGSATAILLASPAAAASGTITFELPRLNVQTYHKPYTAIWLEDSSGKQVKVYRVFYDQTKIGERWLPDLRTWWRRGGRSMSMPVAGVSRPSRGSGRYSIAMGSLSALRAGRYAIVVEAAREKGGRELVKVPFNWQPGTAVNSSANGSSEVGRVSVSITR